MTLRDKVVLVTGAGCGIGAAIALAMAREGARVVAADIDAAAAAAGARAESLALTADVGDLAQINGMVADAVKAFGRLDVMVNNAGVTRQADIMDLSEADWDRIHRVNAKGLFFCLQRAARQMIDQGDGGCIINMASIAGRGYIGTSNAAYAASKGAVIALTKTAAQQLGRHDINVNAICPGVTLTPLVDGLLETRARERGIGRDEALDRAARPIPIGRLNEPADIAAMAVFLASPGARNITGQAFNVDGGLVPS
jgi:NAD(P)-dependent dehydrogenase (short-subunit alcohol dehydrogenase family)